MRGRQVRKVFQPQLDQLRKKRLEEVGKMVILKAYEAYSFCCMGRLRKSGNVGRRKRNKELLHRVLRDKQSLMELAGKRLKRSDRL